MRAPFDTVGWMTFADAAAPAHDPCCVAREAAPGSAPTLIAADRVVDETLKPVRYRPRQHL
jgi:hypothetical protein